MTSADRRTENRPGGKLVPPEAGAGWATPGPGGDPIVVGRVGKPFGIAGEVYVHADRDLDEPLRVGLACGADAGQTLVITGVREHGARLLVRFAGVEDRDAAEALRGTVLTLPREEVSLGEGMVWVDALLGREVVDHDGALVGTVEAVLDGAAHDFLLIARPDGGEVLVPLVAALVDTDVDPIRLASLAGLVDG